MSWKKTFAVVVLGLTLAVPISVAAQSPADGVMLPVPFIRQQCRAWCWAAASQMVANYYGIYGDFATQCVMASINSGRIGPYGEPICCAYGCGYPGCDAPASEMQLNMMLSRHLLVDNQFIWSPLTEADLQSVLLAGQPVIIGLKGYFTGHVIVVYGFFNSGGVTYYLFHDPNSGSNRATYAQLRQGFPGTGAAWSVTWYRLAPYGR